MAQLKEDEWPEPGEETTQEREARLRPRGTSEPQPEVTSDVESHATDTPPPADDRRRSR